MSEVSLHQFSDDRLVAALLLRGQKHFAANRIAKAIEAWKEVLALSPGHERALDYLAAVGVGADSEAPQGGERRQDHLESDASLRSFRLRGEVPFQPEIEALVTRGDLEGALNLLYRARDENPADPTVARGIRWLKDRLSLIFARRLGDHDRVPRSAPSSLEQRQALNPGEQYVLARVDGTSSFGDILSISNLGQYNTYRCLLALADGGLIKLAAGDPEPARAQESDDAEAVEPGKEEAKEPVPTWGAPAPSASDPDAAAFREATKMYVQGRYEEALEQFLELAEAHPADPRIRHNIQRLKEKLRGRT
jgi:tetratricopeptide (TPR) repeat protein